MKAHSRTIPDQVRGLKGNGLAGGGSVVLGEVKGEFN